MANNNYYCPNCGGMLTTYGGTPEERLTGILTCSCGQKYKTDNYQAQLQEATNIFTNISQLQGMQPTVSRIDNQSYENKNLIDEIKGTIGITDSYVGDVAGRLGAIEKILEKLNLKPPSKT